MDRGSRPHPARPRAVTSRVRLLLTPLATVAVLVCAIAGCGADGCEPASNATPQPPTPPAPGTVGSSGIPVGKLIDMLYELERPIAEKARIQLLALRGLIVPHLEAGFDRGIVADRYGELVKLMIEIGQRPQERKTMVDLLERWLEREITPEKLLQFQRLPPLDPPPKDADEKRAQKEARAKFQAEQTKIGRMISTLVSALLELEADDRIRPSIRVVYFASVLAEKSQAGMEAIGLGSREAAANLLSIGPEALPAIATFLNSTDDDVSRRFFGVALWMWQPAMVEKILAELAKNGARNMQIYALLGHLTMRPLAIEDLGLPRATQEEFTQRRDELLALWHPKLLANWQEWYAAHGAESIDQWWKDGFKRFGVELPATRSREAIAPLIEALLRDDSNVHVAALHLLQRLTYRDARLLNYLEITEYSVTRVVEHAYPDPAKRPKPEDFTSAKLRELIHADWKAWHAQRADRPSAEWAREEAGYAVATLENLSSLAKLKAEEHAVGYTITFFLRLLTRDPHTSQPGVPNLPWTGQLTAARKRSQLIHHFRTLVDKALEKLKAADRLGGWWPY